MINMKNKRFSTQGVFINLLIISAAICLLSLIDDYGGVTYAEETEERAFINASCAMVNEQITIDIPCAEFSTTQLSVSLDLYPNPADTEGLYFRLRDLPQISENTSSCAFIDTNLNINIKCAAFDESQYALALERYTNPLDSDGFYWKVVGSSNMENLEILDSSDDALYPENIKKQKQQLRLAANSMDIGINAESVNSFQERGTKADLLPNLKPYKRSGVSDKLVIGKTEKPTADSTNLKTTDTLYLGWAITNDSTSKISQPFYIQIYVDGKQTLYSYWSYGLGSGSYAYSTWGWNIGKLSAGQHTIKIKVDSTNVISEGNEYDNEYTKTIYITGSSQDITKPNYSDVKLGNNNPDTLLNLEIDKDSQINLRGTVSDDVGLKKITMLVLGPKGQQTVFSKDISGTSLDLSSYSFSVNNSTYSNKAGTY
ncbi:MAG: hypothetical protein HQK70_10540 [Desulfamplus sp.]|nr:hypothetical protein [Desulfamplus sp.]